MSIMNIAELRNTIKPLGFKVSTKQLSFGAYATYVHIESGQKLTFNVFSPEQMARWKPLLDWRTENRDQLRTLKEATGLIGLIES